MAPASPKPASDGFAAKTDTAKKGDGKKGSAKKTRRVPLWLIGASRLVLLLVATSMATFALIAASPVDPVKENLGQAAYAQMGEAQRAELAEYWGAGTPLPQRYAHCAASALHGDLG